MSTNRTWHIGEWTIYETLHERELGCTHPDINGGQPSVRIYKEASPGKHTDKQWSLVTTSGYKLRMSRWWHTANEAVKELTSEYRTGVIKDHFSKSRDDFMPQPGTRAATAFFMASLGGPEMSDDPDYWDKWKDGHFD